jgi:hypothetical protein
MELKQIQFFGEGNISPQQLIKLRSRSLVDFPESAPQDAHFFALFEEGRAVRVRYFKVPSQPESESSVPVSGLVILFKEGVLHQIHFGY